MFETAGFNAFDLFSELREYGPEKQKELQKKKQLKKLMTDANGDQNLIQQQIANLNQDLNVTSNQPKEDAQEGGDQPDVEGVDDRSLHCFLQVGLQSGTLRTEITEKDCTFLVNLINQSNLKTIPYES